MIKDSGERTSFASGAVRDMHTGKGRFDLLPMLYQPVIVARVYEVGKPLLVESGMLKEGGWWKVYGTNVKKVSYWMPMPEPPDQSGDVTEMVGEP